ncbi:hypothetical protein LMG28614_01830 [Paraburkholderia ultramafica]|uniref:Uncharacterized protein n=1 Tax=Paraburkholderia ultramafica TaxID=1544867 RepID=A0A6S7B0W2_9BURK|nr:hypothetical protein LMG28614_01830 [Paraburkholderia ultramafica]
MDQSGTSKAEQPASGDNDGAGGETVQFDLFGMPVEQAASPVSAGPKAHAHGGKSQREPAEAEATPAPADTPKKRRTRGCPTCDVSCRVGSCRAASAASAGITQPSSPALSPP